MTFAEQQAVTNSQLTAGLASLSQALVMSIDEAAGTAVLNVGGSNLTMPMLRKPTPGWNAWYGTFGSDRLCFGPVYRPTGGVVTVVPALGVVGFLDDGGTPRSMPVADGLTLAIGDRVAVDWENQLVYSKPASEADVVVPVPPDGGGPVDHEQAFFPVDSGSYGSSWFTTRVYSSDSNFGAFFYDGIADTIPDGAEILSVRIHLDAIQSSGGNPSFGMHNLSSKSGAPTITGAVTIGSGTGDFDLPKTFGDSLKTGAQKGIGSPRPGGGYSIYSPANTNNSGTLTIRWRTTS